MEEAVAVHLCPPTALGWKMRASHPLKPCRTTSVLASKAFAADGQGGSALHTMAVLQVYQATLLRKMDESGPDQTIFKELCSTTDLALRTTKATAQAIGHAKDSLLVLEHHSWLNLTKIKDVEKMGLLYSPVSPSGLFGSVVDGLPE